jgi:competence protein ComEC
VRLKRPHGLANAHGFDYEGWLLERNLRATGTVRPGGASLEEDLVHRPAYLVERLRERLRERFWDALPDSPHAGVLVALAIGEQRAIDPAEWQLFARTGVSHLMSISGLHVTMIAALVAALAQFLWRRWPRMALALPAQKAAAAAGFMGALAYCVLSGFAVPAQRTLYMVGVVGLAFWFNRAGMPSRVLAVALGLVLLLDPWAVLEPGFWLSFSAVALIFYVTLGRPRPAGALAQWASVQWAMTLGLAPLTLLLFKQVSLVSPIANAIAIPLVSFVIAPLSLIGMLLPWDFLLHAAHALLAVLLRVLEALGSLDHATWRQHAPLMWTVPLAVVGALWLLAPRGFPARLLGLVLMLPLLLALPPQLPAGQARIDVLDVGQGTAVSVRTRNHALLYDAGPAWGSRPDAGTDSGARVVVPFLRGEGVEQLDALIVSHDDNDHAGGAASVMESLPTGLLLSSLGDDHPLQAKARLRAACLAGFEWSWDGVRFVVLHPGREQYANPFRSLNDRSCVLRIEAGEEGTRGSALLAGDIERFAERDLLRRVGEASLAADLLLVPHHGSNTSSTPELVAKVAPRYAVFSAGYRNRFGHPRPEVVARYAEQGSVLLRSDRSGQVSMTLGAGAPFAQAYRETARRYWHGR